MKFEKWLAVTIMNIQDIRSSFIRLFFDALENKKNWVIKQRFHILH